jgi:hypothetical protein
VPATNRASWFWPIAFVTTLRSMYEGVEDGYDLVSVVAPSNQTRAYFFRKTGKIAKCRETAGVTGPPPTLGRVVAQRNGSLSVPDIPVPDMQIDVDCAELVRPASATR